MRGYGDIAATLKPETNTKEEQLRRAIGTQISALGLEGVEVRSEGGHMQYTCRPRTERPLLLKRVQKLIKFDGVRVWQEWLLRGSSMVVAIVIDIEIAKLPGAVRHLRGVVKSTMVSPKKMEIPIKLDNRPKVGFNLGNSKDEPGMAGAHPLGGFDV
jgi:hypothetical protein